MTGKSQALSSNSKHQKINHPLRGKQRGTNHHQIFSGEGEQLKDEFFCALIVVAAFAAHPTMGISTAMTIYTPDKHTITQAKNPQRLLSANNKKAAIETFSNALKPK